MPRSTKTICIAVGPYCWGKGDTVQEAVAAMRKNWPGMPREPYSLKKVSLIFCNDPDAYVNDMGGLTRHKDSTWLQVHYFHKEKKKQ